MLVEILDDEEKVAARGAALIAEAAVEAVSTRGRFLLALSGGRTPWLMISDLARRPVPWEATHIFQVDERIAPSGSAERNLTRLEAILSSVPARIHDVPVAEADSAAAAASYAHTLDVLAGHPPVLDLIHLGLGADGHTASLIPGDPILGVTEADAAVTGPYQGRRRISMTFPVLNRARRVLWIVTGADKKDALARLRRGDETIPAGRVRRDRALLIADRSAAGA